MVHIEVALIPEIGREVRGGVLSRRQVGGQWIQHGQRLLVEQVQRVVDRVIQFPWIGNSPWRYDASRGRGSGGARGHASVVAGRETIAIQHDIADLVCPGAVPCWIQERAREALGHVPVRMPRQVTV